GGKRRFTVDRVEFAGYGLDAPGASHSDYRGKDVKDAAVVWLGSSGPKGLDQATYRRLLMGRNRYATEQLGAVASVGPGARGGGAGTGGTGRRRRVTRFGQVGWAGWARSVGRVECGRTSLRPRRAAAGRRFHDG